MFACGEVEAKEGKGCLQNRPRPRTKAEYDDEHEDEHCIGMFVIPAKAGIHFAPDLNWIPAFAGMTDNVDIHDACVSRRSLS